MAIFRARIRDTKGKHVGFKLFDARSEKEAKRKLGSIVGPGRRAELFEKTRLRGSVAQRRRLPRSKRFGSGFY